MIRLTNEWHKNALARAVPGARFEDGWWVVDDDPDPRAAAIIVRLFPETMLTLQHSDTVRPFDEATPYIEAHPERAIAHRATRVVEIMKGL